MIVVKPSGSSSTEMGTLIGWGRLHTGPDRERGISFGGYDIWRDEVDLRAGDDWRAAILKQIRQ